MQIASRILKDTGICAGPHCPFNGSNNVTLYTADLQENASENDAAEEALFIGFAVIIPLICIFGIVGNIINLIVLCQPDFQNKSPYILLKALSLSDLTTLILEMLNGIGQGARGDQIGWKIFDIYCHLPVGSISTTMSISMLTTYTIERFIFVKATHLARRYCRAKVALKAIVFLLIFSILFNVPYFFTFYLDDQGNVCSTHFSMSSYFEIHDCVRLLLLGVTPALILAYVNCTLVVTLHQALRRRKVLRTQHQYRVHNKARITVCLTMVVVMFVIGQLPPYLTSRTSAPDLLYGGDETKLETMQYQIIRMVSTVLMCIHYAINFLLYCTLDKTYDNVFRRLFCRICANVNAVQTISAGIP